MHRVYSATPADVKYAAHTIVKAFIGDPFNAYFYNYMKDQTNPPWGTEEMMEIHIYHNLLTKLVLAVDEGNTKCAGVALWDVPRVEPMGWLEWTASLIHTAYGGLMGYLYYRDRGINRKVLCLSLAFTVEVSRVSKCSGKNYGEGSWEGV
jgi:hypothetical protein